MNSTKKRIVQFMFAVMIMTIAASTWAGDAVDSAPVVNINSASETELTYLPGVGPATAAHIIEYRQKQPFKQTKHLMRVKGIGRKTFQKIERYIVVEGKTTATQKIRSISK